MVKNAPFFLSGLGVDDVIELCDMNSEEEITEWRVVFASGRSVIWIGGFKNASLDDLLREFRKINCNTSVRSQLNYAAIDVPTDVTREQVDAIINYLDDQSYAVAFPCDRQI